MNTLEGRIEDARGSGPVRLVEVSSSIGTLSALVLDVGSPERTFEPGRRVRILFKETAAVAAAAHHRLLEGRVERLARGEVLCDMEIWWPCGQRASVAIPFEDLPPGLSVGDGFRLHVPASSVALELR